MNKILSNIIWVSIAAFMVLILCEEAINPVWFGAISAIVGLVWLGVMVWAAIRLRKLPDQKSE